MKTDPFVIEAGNPVSFRTEQPTEGDAYVWINILLRNHHYHKVLRIYNGKKEWFCLNEKGSTVPVNNTQPKIPKPEVTAVRQFAIVSIAFGNSVKTYDYLLNNKSKQRITKDQKVELVSGSRNNQCVAIKHLIKCDKIPKHVTKQLIVTSPTSAIVGFLDKGGTT